jgi:hypothetical protein
MSNSTPCNQNKEASELAAWLREQHLHAFLTGERIPSTNELRTIVRAAIQARDERIKILERTDSLRAAVLERYQACARRLWDLFPIDLLGDSPAQSFIERLEGLISGRHLKPSDGG